MSNILGDAPYPGQAIDVILDEVKLTRQQGSPGVGEITTVPISVILVCVADLIGHTAPVEFRGAGQQVPDRAGGIGARTENVIGLAALCRNRIGSRADK